MPDPPAGRNADGSSYDPWTHLKRLGFAEHTPLWYYILLEAEVEAIGLTLGTLGSRLVAEVIEAALNANPHSFVSQRADWMPREWRAADGIPMRIQTLLHLAVFVGLAKRV